MSKNKIKVLDRHFCNKLDRKQSNKKERQQAAPLIQHELECFKAFKLALLDNYDIHYAS